MLFIAENNFLRLYFSKSKSHFHPSKCITSARLARDKSTIRFPLNRSTFFSVYKNSMLSRKLYFLNIVYFICRHTILIKSEQFSPSLTIIIWSLISEEQRNICEQFCGIEHRVACVHRLVRTYSVCCSDYKINVE